MPRSIATVLVSAALLAAPAGALGASRPSFAHSYRGTISGTFSSSEGGNVVKGQWKIAKLVFRLTKVQAFEGGFTGIYKVTRGTVSYSETETGTCSYSAGDKFGLARALPHPNPSTPLALDQDPLGRKTILGLINVNRKIKTTESCPDPDGGPPTTTARTLALPTLFDPGEKRWRPGRRLHSTNRQTDRSSKQAWTWNLRPGR
jgi:hypothetical protein